MSYLLQHLLSESAKLSPGKTALVFNDVRMTYEQVDRESNKLARLLRKLGVEKGDRVGIYLNKSADSVIAVLGILKMGAAYVPLNPMAPVNHLNYIISNCDIRLVITQREKLINLTKAFSESNPLQNILIMDELSGKTKSDLSINVVARSSMVSVTDDPVPDIQITDTDLAYILFTSGSTGEPKGVMISHRNSLTFVNMACDFFDIKSSDVLANHAPLHFDLSVFDIFVAFKAGACVTIVPDHTANFPSILADFIAGQKITVWNSVPSVLSLLVSYTNLNNYNLSSLRLILYAGEVFPLKYLRQLKKKLPTAKLYNVYGQTEANSSTYYCIDALPADDAKPIPIGKSFPNFEVFALDENGKRITQPEEKGELYVRSSSVAYGYWGDPEKTAGSFVKNPLHPNVDERVYKTGDLVCLDADGNYVFLSRKDHLIKSKGYRIELGEIEAAIVSHPQIKQGVVIPIPDELIGNRIAAILVLNSEGEIEKRDVVSHCSKKLARYMIPEIIEFRSSLPLTSSGKIDRKALLADLQGRVVPLEATRESQGS